MLINEKAPRREPKGPIETSNANQAQPVACCQCLNSGWLLLEDKPCTCSHGEALTALYADFTAKQMEEVRAIRLAALRSGLIAMIGRYDRRAA